LFRRLLWLKIIAKKRREGKIILRGVKTSWGEIGSRKRWPLKQRNRFEKIQLPKGGISKKGCLIPWWEGCKGIDQGRSIRGGNTKVYATAEKMDKKKNARPLRGNYTMGGNERSEGEKYEESSIGISKFVLKRWENGESYNIDTKGGP